MQSWIALMRGGNSGVVSEPLPAQMPLPMTMPVAAGRPGPRDGFPDPVQGAA